MITYAPITNNTRILCVPPSQQASKTVLRLQSHSPKGHCQWQEASGSSRQETNIILCLPESPPSRDSLLERRMNG
jgi:hypothetical protein